LICSTLRRFRDIAGFLLKIAHPALFRALQSSPVSEMAVTLWHCQQSDMDWQTDSVGRQPAAQICLGPT